eukprot:scaffold50210_cov63-Phaeocystis_antarctica.AAC.2
MSGALSSAVPQRSSIQKPRTGTAGTTRQQSTAPPVSPQSGCTPRVRRCGSAERRRRTGTAAAA